VLPVTIAEGSEPETSVRLRHPRLAAGAGPYGPRSRGMLEARSAKPLVAARAYGIPFLPLLKQGVSWEVFYE